MNTRSCACSKTVFARSVGLFFGLFSLLNVAGGVLLPGFDANLWWIDTRFVPDAIGRALLFMCGVIFLAFAAQPPKARWRRIATMVAAMVLGSIAFLNAAQFYWLLVRGVIVS